MHKLFQVCYKKINVVAHWRFNYWESGKENTVVDHSGMYVFLFSLFHVNNVIFQRKSFTFET